MSMSGIIVLFIIALACFGIVHMMNQGQKEKAIPLKEAYDKAIASGDKQAALVAGRAYYSKLRGGMLTTYDEQAIANDLSAM